MFSPVDIESNRAPSWKSIPILFLRRARSLGLAMRKSGIEIVEVWGRDTDKAKSLAKELNAARIYEPSGFNADVDAVAVLVSDDAIKELSSKIPFNISKFHASGTTPLSDLSCDIAGVFWPIKSINEETVKEGFKNASHGKATAAEIKKFMGLFTSEFKDGDKIHIEYISGEGVSALKNGKKLGSVPGLEFKKALFSIWLGKKPADSSLKKGMLGKV